MKIVSKISELKAKPKSYPWIGIYPKYNTLIVLFTGPNTGTCIYSDGESLDVYLHMVGGHSTTWIEKDFKPYYGAVELCMKE